MKYIASVGKELFLPEFSQIMQKESRSYLIPFSKILSGEVERSQNTVLLASTQTVYKAPHSTVRDRHRVPATDTDTHSHGTGVRVAVAVGSLRA